MNEGVPKLIDLITKSSHQDVNKSTLKIYPDPTDKCFTDKIYFCSSLITLTLRTHPAITKKRNRQFTVVSMSDILV